MKKIFKLKKGEKPHIDTLLLSQWLMDHNYTTVYHDEDGYRYPDEMVMDVQLIVEVVEE